MSIFRKDLLGSILLVGESLSQKLIGLISTLVLARILVPEDFGLVAIALLCMNFFEVLSKTGGLQYLLRADELTEDIVNTSWTIDLALKVPLAIVLAAVGPAISSFYGDERLTNIIYFLSLLLIVQSLKNPGEAFLRRNHEYLAIIKIGLIAKLASISTAISIAIIYESYWALILGQFVNSLSQTILSYKIHPHRPTFSLTNIKTQWQFSAWMIPQSIVGFFRTQLDTLLVSATFDKDVLGSYHVMKYLAFIPSANIVLPATQPLLVELAKVKHSSTFLKKQFNISFIVMMIIALPIVMLINDHHPLIIAILLGEGWVAYSELFSIFGLMIISNAILQQSMRILLVYGHTRLIFGYELSSFILIYSAIIMFGIEDIIFFSQIRVGLELISSIVLFVFVTTKYTDLRNLIHLIISLTPLAIGCTSGSLLAQKAFDIFDNNVTTLIFVCVTFYLTFTLTITPLSFSLFKKTTEWAYINNLLLTILRSMHRRKSNIERHE